MNWLSQLFRVKEPDEQRMKFLGKVQLFESLMLSDVDHLLDELVERIFQAGEWVIQTGEAGDGMYIVESGEVEVLIGEEDNHQTVATFAPGDYFGEMSLLENKPRSASIKASKDSTLLFLPKRNFFKMLSKNKRTALKITYNIAKTLSSRLRAMNVTCNDNPE